MPPTLHQPPVALTIAGSDSGGGAGIQADLRVMHRLGVFGTSAITAITAQNTGGVRDVEGVRPSLLQAQLDAVLEGFAVGAIKTGMLWSAALVDVVAARVATLDIPVIVDPVMVATSGARLLDGDAVERYRGLFAHATVATPNLDEAAVLLGRPVDRSALHDEAASLAAALGCAVLLKGGHLDGPPEDVLVAAGETFSFRHARIEGVNTHGSGCMLSSAIAAFSALGRDLPDACAHGLAFVHDALAKGAHSGRDRLAHIEGAHADLRAISTQRR